ncbi:ABC transporter substrate-binding protein [Secundilactobacillus similis]|uniref:ABC transporter substrate-binding protein n=1 Tax=Secundilactobacillus similis TaxID=414682 RepID=UPI0006D121E0|nr:ABC transporter substrate-binding protein [Secundilactobacillus similis]
MQLKTTLQISLAVGLVVMLTTGFYIRDIPDSTQAVHTTTLRVGTSTPIETLDSSTYTSHEAYEALVSTLVGLYRYNGQNKITPAISDGHPTKSKDGLTYVFTLRDFKWSNGDRVTAGDFVYAWRRLANPKTNSRNASRMDFLKNGEAFEPVLNQSLRLV